MVLSLGFIVVSETSKTQSGDDSWHVDFSLLRDMYTVILPVVLTSSKEPELMFKHQLAEKRGIKDIILNYKWDGPGLGGTLLVGLWQSRPTFKIFRLYS